MSCLCLFGKEGKHETPKILAFPQRTSVAVKDSERYTS